jgi:hypothetical protein
MFACAYSPEDDTLIVVDIIAGEAVLIVEGATAAGMPNSPDDIIGWLDANYSDVLSASQTVECKEDDIDDIGHMMAEILSAPLN